MLGVELDELGAMGVERLLHVLQHGARCLFARRGYCLFDGGDQREHDIPVGWVERTGDAGSQRRV